jgi:hypothetical protein
VAARLFFPQRQALGLAVDEDLSPALLEKVTYLGAKLPSFRDAHESLGVLLRLEIGLKRVERITERIGGERVAERETQIEEWSRLPLVQRDQAPAGVKPPEVGAVLADGGRLQLREQEEGDASHWHEYKAGALHALSSETSASDPCPQVPEVYLQRDRIDRLTRDISQVAAVVETPSATGIETALPETQPAEGELISAEETIPCGYEPPQIIDRDVVASRRDSRAFGKHLAAQAWSLGLFAAGRKAWISDGQNWLWTEWEKYFKPFGFVPILDFIHALTHVYAAATAGRSVVAGWEVYVRWITWIWQGNVPQVIAELAARQQELGLPTEDDGETSPRRLVAGTLTYLQNQKGRMNYPEYRRQGLPITSAHMESTVKQLNRRVKGSEKYWSDQGSEALLQLVADQLSTSQPLAKFWSTRPGRHNGYRTYAKAAA